MLINNFMLCFMIIVFYVVIIMPRLLMKKRSINSVNLRKSEEDREGNHIFLDETKAKNLFTNYNSYGMRSLFHSVSFSR